ncbi:MAG: TetR/AcrR family transcriptional regulator [Chryseobacterium sp.]|nr:MAG: TetR/AcrR family transcriptional regulator [Chryseobacterium sp.]
MSSAKKDDTESLIRQTAKNLFFKEGRFGATTQEIADAAQVNRTLINYYFRSRDNLFNIIFEEALAQQRENFVAILTSEERLRKKVEQYVEDSLISALEYPYLEIYIVTQLNRGSSYHAQRPDSSFKEALQRELDEAIAAGEVNEISLQQFILNIASLVSFPICMRPLLEESLNLSREKYNELLLQRKEIIINTIFNN